ncbi:MAG: ABC transporter substrate-binding protein [Thermodesulfobacteriota bacterium]
METKKASLWTKVAVTLSTVMLLLVFSNSVFAREQVVVYTTFELDEANQYLKVAKQDLPDLEITWLRLSTGELAARILAEKDNPKADVIWGLAATNCIILKEKGAITPYKPRDWEKIPAQFKDSEGYWHAVDLFVGAMALNTAELKRKNLPEPATYDDLLNPAYKGMIIMPNPATSGTGVIHLVANIILRGEDKAFGYFKGLSKNIAQFTSSGSAPARMAAQGEVPIGLSLELPILQYKREGYPVKLVWPKEGTGYEMDSNALVKGAKHEAAAKKFLDWAISKNAMQEIAKLKVVIPYPGLVKGKDMPSAEEIPLIKMDFDWNAKNRDRLMKKWAETVTK